MVSHKWTNDNEIKGLRLALEGMKGLRNNIGNEREVERGRDCVFVCVCERESHWRSIHNHLKKNVNSHNSVKTLQYTYVCTSS